jgi:hypothetical protein
MTPAKIRFGCLVALAIAGTLPSADAASLRSAPAPMVTHAAAAIMSTDFNANRRHSGRSRHITRVHIYRRGDYSFFEPYAPPVPPFFPFGYRQGYF